MTLFIRKKFNLSEYLEKCPFCDNKDDFTDVSSGEYPFMFECNKCGKITQVMFDL